MKIIIDNNIITEENIKKINEAGIFNKIKENKMEFYASAKLYEQLLPYLLKLNDTKRKLIVDFLYELTGNSRIFDSIGSISQKELDNTRGKYQFVPCAMQKRIIPTNLYSQTNVQTILNLFNRSMPNAKAAHNEIKNWASKNRKFIQDLSSKKISDIDNNITDIMSKRGFDEKSISAAINIVKSGNELDSLSAQEKKNRIYENLFFLLMEFDFLVQLKEQKQLIKNENFYKSYYPQYYKPSFTKTMVKTTLYGYSYKVCGDQYQKSYDEDWVNDSSYICYTYFADILLTNDTKYMKNAFDWIYEKNKEILTLNEFIDKYCKR